MKKLFLFVFLFTSVCAMFAQPSTDDMDNDTKKLYNEGIKFSKEGKYKQAIEQFDSALKNSNNYLLYMRKGTALQRLVKNASSAEREQLLNDAIAAYQGCFETYPKYDLAYFKIGSAYFALKDYENAIANFEKAKAATKNKKYVKVADKNIAKAKEKIAYPILLKANDYYSKKNYNEAIAGFLKVLTYYQSDVAYLALSDLYNETGDYNKALEAAQNAITYTKTIPKGGPYYFMGVALKKLGQNENAIANFKECLKDKKKKNKGYRDRANHDLAVLQK